jgi:hypothetical protein
MNRASAHEQFAPGQHLNLQGPPRVGLRPMRSGQERRVEAHHLETHEMRALRCDLVRPSESVHLWSPEFR